MYSVEQDMKVRISEARELISLVELIESGLVSSPQNIKTPILRASVVISLYNTIESTITKTLTKFHDEINKSKTNYNNLSREIRDLALIYFYKHKEKRSNIHDSIDVLHHTVDLVRGKGFFNVPYDEMVESYQLYSGNLDAREIRRVMKKYGIEISENHGKKLVNVKKGRNTLSHGNQSFEEFGRDIVAPTLQAYLFDVEQFLEEVIEKSKQFVLNKHYRSKKTRRKK